MSHFRSIFRFINSGDSYQVSSFGPENNRYFLPSDIPGLAGWWDATDNAYLTGTGNNVTHWSNKGSAGGNISGTVGSLLTKVPGYKNGLQAIYYSTGSVNSRLETSMGARFLDGATTKCWFIVFQSNPLVPPSSQPNAYDLPVIVIDRFATVALTEGTKQPGTDIARWYFGGSGAGFTQFLSSSDVSGKHPVSGSDFIINAIAQVDTTSPYANHLTMSINDSPDETRISTDFMGTNIAEPYGISTRPSSGQRGTPRNRYLYEILFYTNTLTQTQRLQVTNYLRNKWGIF